MKSISQSVIPLSFLVLFWPLLAFCLASALYPPLLLSEWYWSPFHPVSQNVLIVEGVKTATKHMDTCGF